MIELETQLDRFLASHCAAKTSKIFGVRTSELIAKTLVKAVLAQIERRHVDAQKR